MRTHILISQKVQEEHKDIFNEINRILKERFDEEVDFQIISDVAYRAKSKIEKDTFWENQCRFLCLATDEQIGDLIGKSCDHLIPCIMIRGKESIRLDYIALVKELLLKEKDITFLKDNCIEKMFFEVSKLSDIKGAIIWINSFYHAMKDSLREEYDAKYQFYFRGADNIGRK
jgi:hypothetical protein